MMTETSSAMQGIRTGRSGAKGMGVGQSLQEYLTTTPSMLGDATAVARVIERLAQTAVELADLIAAGDLAGDFGHVLSDGPGGDPLKALDLKGHTLFRDALRGCGVAAFASEEAAGVESLDENGPLGIAMDPIDGSGGIESNTSIGTIFSIVAMDRATLPVNSSGAGFAWPAGDAQLAAGFFLYGPQTTLVMTVSDTVDVFTLDRAAALFRLTRQAVRLPDGPVHDYAVNASNYRHWEEPVRAFVDECVAGETGHYGRNFNTRWHGALVAEAYRIIGRGGIYLYPGDARDGYREGRLRLIYEAYPMALLVERAGGAASTGRRRILSLEAQSLHQRVPLIFGSKAMVERVDGLHHRPDLWPSVAAPLFASRGLFRS